MTYDEAVEKMKDVLDELGNDDKLRIAGAIVSVLSDIEGCEYFQLDNKGEIEVVMITGKSATYIAECVKLGKFEEKN